MRRFGLVRLFRIVALIRRLKARRADAAMVLLGPVLGMLFGGPEA